ncbi:hypothetical protein AVEN_250154-1, partial [Araneus ventricosus]
MENDGLFRKTRITGNSKPQHLHKLIIPADSKSANNSAQCLTAGQVSKEILRTPKTFKDDHLISATP